MFCQGVADFQREQLQSPGGQFLSSHGGPETRNHCRGSVSGLNGGPLRQLERGAAGRPDAYLLPGGLQENRRVERGNRPPGSRPVRSHRSGIPRWDPCQPADRGGSEESLCSMADPAREPMVREEHPQPCLGVADGSRPDTNRTISGETIRASTLSCCPTWKPSLPSRAIA